MKNFIIFTLMVFLLLIVGAYLWKQYRPSDIKARCYQYLNLKEGESYYVNVEEINNKYRACLEDNGIEPEDLVITDTLIQ